MRLLSEYIQKISTKFYDTNKENHNKLMNTIAKYTTDIMWYCINK